jgi:hypothetical protein
MVAEEMRTQLQAWGYRVVEAGPELVWDGQESSALTEAREAGAGVLIVGLAEARQIRNEATATLVQVTAQARLLVTRPRTQLAQERRQTTVAHSDATLGAQQALKEVSTALMGRLVIALKAYQQQVREQQLREQQLREQQAQEQQLRESPEQEHSSPTPAATGP